MCTIPSCPSPHTPPPSPRHSTSRMVRFLTAKAISERNIGHQVKSKRQNNKMKSNELGWQNLERHNSRQTAKHAKLSIRTCSQFKTEPQIALGSQKRGTLISASALPTAQSTLEKNLNTQQSSTLQKNLNTQQNTLQKIPQHAAEYIGEKPQHAAEYIGEKNN